MRVLIIKLRVLQNPFIRIILYKRMRDSTFPLLMKLKSAAATSLNLFVRISFIYLKY